MKLPNEVPSPIDLRLPQDAAEWERTALEKRPWRTEFFQCFAEQIEPQGSTTEVVELGSGPGFLAAHLLAQFPQLKMTLLDFSAAMHDLARSRLTPHINQVKFIERNFKEAGWHEGLGKFSFVVTNQAVHELRHKRHAKQLHEQVRSLLAHQGRYLVCDHYAGVDAMSNTDLYMSVAEQRAALEAAGFRSVVELKRKGGLVLHSAA